MKIKVLYRNDPERPLTDPLPELGGRRFVFRLYSGDYCDPLGGSWFDPKDLPSFVLRARQAGNFNSTSAQVNFMSNIANIAYLKRIQLIPGSVVQAYKPADIQKELAKCQRYYWKTFPDGIAVAQNGGVAGAISYLARFAGAINDNIWVANPVRMRVGPTVTFYNPSAANTNWRNTSVAADSGGSSTQTGPDAYGFLINNGQAAGDGVAQLLRVHLTANARLA